MAILLHIESTPPLFLSDEGVNTSEGAAWSAGIVRTTASPARIATARKPQFVFPTLAAAIENLSLLDPTDLVGKRATAYQGEGVVLAGYTRIFSGVVDRVRSAGGSRAEVMLRPSVSNQEVTIQRPQVGQRLGQHASDIAIGANIVHSFDDWREDRSSPRGSVVVENEPLLDVLAQLAFESFWDIAWHDNTLRAVPRFTVVGAAVPEDTRIVRVAREDSQRMLSDPFDEACNRLHIRQGNTIYTYNDTASQAALGVIKERSILLRFVEDEEAARNQWAARYFIHYGAVRTWLEAEIAGEFFAGDEFLWIPSEDGTYYQVREGQMIPSRLSTRIKALRRAEEPLPPPIPTLAPTGEREVEDPTGGVPLYWGEGDTLIRATEKTQALVPTTPTLPEAISSTEDDITYSVEDLPSWMAVDLSTRQITATANAPALAGYALRTFTWIATNTRGLSIRQTITIELTPTLEVTFLGGPEYFSVPQGTQDLDPVEGTLLPQAVTNNGEDIVYSVADLQSWMAVNLATRAFSLSADAPTGLTFRRLTFQWIATAGAISARRTIIVEVRDPPSTQRILTWEDGDTTIQVETGGSTLEPTVPILPAAASNVDETVTYAVTDLPSWLVFDADTRAIAVASGQAAPTGLTYPLITFTLTASADAHEPIVQTIIVNVQSPTPVLAWEDGDELVNVQTGKMTIEPAMPVLPEAISNVGSMIVYSTLEKPDWLNVDLMTRAVTLGEAPPAIPYGLISFQWVATDETNSLMAVRTINVEVRPIIPAPDPITGLAQDHANTTQTILAFAWDDYTDPIDGYAIEWRVA